MVSSNSKEDEIERYYKYYLSQAAGDSPPDFIQTSRSQKGGGLFAYILKVANN